MTSSSAAASPERPDADPADMAAADVAIVGLGYVGLTLAVAFATAGLRVVGVDRDQRVLDAVEGHEAPFFEPGVTEALRALPRGALRVSDTLPDRLPRAVIVSVSTPVESETRSVDLRSFRDAITEIARRLEPDVLVVIRSTVPVGTTTDLVLPLLLPEVRQPLVAMCPERTIQGRALDEVSSLPQVIGGVDARSTARADELFAAVAARRVLLSSSSAAEMVKLVNNAHTDLIYAFGNEVAFMAERFGVDALEVVHAANVDYPRPDLARPGYVGGSCLTKDPYLLASASSERGHDPLLVTAARRVNEAVPLHVVHRLEAALGAEGRTLAGASVLVCGVAYKGSPPTDDVRGSAAPVVARALEEGGAKGLGHDFLVAPEGIACAGLEPVGLAEGWERADAVVFLVDHPDYGAHLADLPQASAYQRPLVVVDVWGVAAPLAERSDVRYHRFGRG